MFFVFFVFCIYSVLAKNELYLGYRVYNVQFDTLDQQNKFDMLKNDVIDFWRKPSLKHNIVAKAMVPPSHIAWFEENLNKLDIVKDIYIDDVYMYLKYKDGLQQTYINNMDDGFNFDSYHRYDPILNYMKTLNNTSINSKIVTEFVEAGKTDENRTLAYLRISANDTGIVNQKPIIVIEAGINPREWITVPTALNIVNKFIEGNEIRLLENLEWIIIPVLNPDGYEFTHTTSVYSTTWNLQDQAYIFVNLRLWTKSRSTRSHMGVICPGVNINRNFDIDWMHSDSSSSPCSHIYGGIEPFSEPESQLIRNLLQDYGNRISLYISLQNNGGFVSYPWQYERAASGMFRQHHLLGLEMISAIADNYTLDVASLALGDRASGTSTDYVRDKNIFYTFNIDIKQSDGGVVIPEIDIKSIAERVWRAVVKAAESIISK